MGSTIKGALGELLIRAIEKAGLDPAVTEQHALRCSSVDDWVRRQRIQAGGAGAVAGLGVALLPGRFKLAGVGLEMGALAHKMSVLTWGVGYRSGSIVDTRLDLANVLSLWCGAVRDDALANAVGRAAVGGGAIGVARQVQRALPSVSAAAVGVPVLGAVSSAIAQKAAENFALIVAEKVVSVTVPGLAGVCGSEATTFLADKRMKALEPMLTAKLAESLNRLARPMAGSAASVVAGAVLNNWLVSSVARSAIPYYEHKVAAMTLDIG